MATATETVRNFMMALEAAQFDTAKGYLADSFTFSGWTPGPLNRDDFMTVMSGLKSSMPNLSYHFHGARELEKQEQDSQEIGSVQISGTQENSLNLPPLSLPPIPQMAHTVSLPPTHWYFTLQNGLISLINVERVQGGDVHALLNQLGTDVRPEQ
ncbi:MAG: hypothetical protein ABI406_04875 [Ktedonobacteraceae bacterium]